MAKSIYWIYKPYQGKENGLGYSIHNRNMFNETKKHIDVEDPYSDWHFQIVPADQAYFNEAKKNILFTMWEFPEVPESYKENLSKADVVFVPCAFCRDIFKPYTKKEPIVVWEGVDYKTFPYYQRKLDNKFRILWSGARNTRKGYQHAIDLIRLIGHHPDIEIYIKTHANLNKEQILIESEKLGASELEKFLDVHKSTQEVRVLGQHQNIFFDMRNLPIEELRDLYNSAHVFLFSTHGEGWGLMGTEVLSTGCPLIANPVTGVRDWFDAQVGFPLTYHERTIPATNYNNMEVTTYEPDLNSILEQVFYVKNNYAEALARGKRGSNRMKEKYSWQQAGIRMAKIIERL